MSQAAAAEGEAATRAAAEKVARQQANLDEVKEKKERETAAREKRQKLLAGLKGIKRGPPRPAPGKPAAPPPPRSEPKPKGDTQAQERLVREAEAMVDDLLAERDRVAQHNAQAAKKTILVGEDEATTAVRAFVFFFVSQAWDGIAKGKECASRPLIYQVHDNEFPLLIISFSTYYLGKARDA